MKIKETKISISDLSKNYSDNGDGGVFAYDNRLTVRPEYQREFVYKDKQRDAVIETLMQNYPLNVMYWSKTGDDTYEIIDGQQRTISICQYINNDFSIDHKYFHNLTITEQQAILDYELTVYICEGTEKEKLDWFRIINIAGEVLTPQELLNATYTGKWLTNAKTYFSKRNCVAGQMGDGYIKGNPIRQEYLERALKWIADRDELKCGEDYMAAHQKDDDADELWQYYQDVINWAKKLFPQKHKGITDAQEWGLLYNRYKNDTFNANILKSDLDSMILDDDVTKKSGIIPYLLSGKSSMYERELSIRLFTPSQIAKAYKEQGGICPICKKNGITKIYTQEEMEADHIIPWSQGGKTEQSNLQMLCKSCNRKKSDN